MYCFALSSIIGYYKIQSIVLCAISLWLSIVYIVLYTCKCFSDECENQKTHNELQGCYQLSRMESSFDFVAHVGGIKFMRGMVKTITHKHRPTNPTIKQVNEKKKKLWSLEEGKGIKLWERRKIIEMPFIMKNEIFL